MLDVILKVIDKAIELVKLREKNKREFFDIVIDPLFNEFEKVSESYFSLFQSRSLPITDLEAIRNEYLQARIKVTELVEVYRKNVKDEDICKFFESIHEFFYGSKYMGMDGEFFQPSKGREYINLVSGRIERKFAIDLDAQYEKLQTSWGNTVKLYGVLKKKYKLPIRKNA